MQFSKKVIVLIIITIIILIILGAISYFLFVPKYIITGKITDRTNDKGVENVVISADNNMVKTDANGNYKLEGLKRLKKEIEVSVTQPEAFENIKSIKINLKADFISKFKSEDVTKDIKLVPTVEESDKRTNDASKNGKYDDIWTFLSLDGQKDWNNDKNDFVNTYKEYFDIGKEHNHALRSYVIEDVKVLPKWKNNINGKEYENVTKITEKDTFSDNSVQRGYRYWIKEDGYWRYLAASKSYQVKNFVSVSSNKGPLRILNAPSLEELKKEQEKYK